jgi:hypothetical protein
MVGRLVGRREGKTFHEKFKEQLETSGRDW